MTVICICSNDEDCDFAVTAENGKLIRLRFKAGRKQGERVNYEAGLEETETQASSIMVDEEEAGANEIFEYTAFEALLTQDKPLVLFSFWKFHEGEIDGQAIF